MRGLLLEGMSNEVPEKMETWILAGQSNMQGYGLLEGSLPPQKDVWNFSMAGSWEPAAEPLHRLWESFTPVHIALNRTMYGVPETTPAQECAVHENRVRIGGAGLGMSFAAERVRATGRPVGLIPCAHGGTSLEQWSQTLKAQGGASLYGSMLERVRRSGRRPDGLLWYQGESDCGPELAKTYAARLDAWIASARVDLGVPDLPVVVVQLGRVITVPGPESLPTGEGVVPLCEWDWVRGALESLPDRVPHTAMTSAVDLPLVDGIHISTAGLIRLGRRLARVVEGMTSGRSAQPRLLQITRRKAPHGPTILELHAEGLHGGWVPQQHLSGFTVHRADGTLHPTLFVLNAAVRPERREIIEVMVNGDVQEPLQLAYGLGFRPYCSLVDDADMPLPAFLPRMV